MLLASMRRRLASSSSPLYSRLQAMGEQAGVGEAGMVHTHARQRVSAGHGAWAWSMAAWQHGAWQSMGMPGHQGRAHACQGRTTLWTAGHKRGTQTEHVAPCSRASKGRFALLRNGQTYEILVSEAMTETSSAMALAPSTPSSQPAMPMLSMLLPFIAAMSWSEAAWSIPFQLTSICRHKWRVG